MVACVVAVDSTRSGGVNLVPHGTDDRCPGAFRAIAAQDGALVRVRVPGGYLDARGLLALAEIAERFGDGAMDLTARANAQLRGLHESDLPVIAKTLASAGLLPSLTHERVRNIAANPFAGIDPDESIDVRPFVAALDGALVADSALAALPAKFLFAFDGGGRGADTRGADLGAFADGSCDAHGVRHFAIRIAADARTLEVPAHDVIAVMLALARRALACATAAGCATDTWRLATLARFGEELPNDLARYERRSASNDGDVSSPERSRPDASDTLHTSHATLASHAPIGILAASDLKHVSLVPQIPLGRLRASQARALATLASDVGADVRLAPWRGIVVGAYPRAELGRASDALRACNLSIDAVSGFGGLAACAGRGACDAALADVRNDAVTYASRVTTQVNVISAGTWRVNFAGCEKRCAMRGGVDLDLIATAGGYDVWWRGGRVATSLEANAAVELALSTRANACERDDAREHTAR